MAPDLEWLKRSRTLLYDAYWPPFHPRLDYDPAKGITVAKKLNANTIRFGTIGKWALYPSAVMPRHPSLGGRDLLGETIKLASKKGVKIVAYIPVAHGLPGVLVRKERPQWAFVLDDGAGPAESMHFGGPGVVPVCPFGPYRQDILKIVREVVEGYDASAIYLDGPYYSWIFEGICQCSACKEKFRADIGRSLPSNAEVARGKDDPEMRELLARHHDWVGAGLVSLIAEIRSIALTKNLPLLFNLCAAEYLKGRRQSEMIENADGFLIESHMGGVKGIGRGVQLGKVVWNYTHRHSCWPRRSTTRVEEENALSAGMSVARGATPIVSYGGRFLLDHRQADPLAKVFATMTAAEPLLTGSVPAKHCALISDLDLQPTEGWTSQQRKSHDRNLYAAYEMLKRNHVQAQVLSKDALSSPSSLDAYAVVCLPTIARFSASHLETIRAFVRKGGGLVVTGATSSCDEKGEMLADFALADVLGASMVSPDPALKAKLDMHWWSQAPGPWDIYLSPKETLRDGSATFELEAPLMVGDFELVTPHQGAQTVADLVYGTDYAPFAPGCVINTFGEGKVAFVPASIEETFAASGFGTMAGDPDLARFLALLCRLVSKKPDPVKFLKGDDERIFASVSAKDGARLLHLVDQKPCGDSVKATVAVHCPAGRPQRVQTASKGTCVDFRFEEGYAIVDLKFARYECVVFQLQCGA